MMMTLRTPADLPEQGSTLPENDNYVTHHYRKIENNLLPARKYHFGANFQAGLLLSLVFMAVAIRWRRTTAASIAGHPP